MEMLTILYSLSLFYPILAQLALNSPHPMRNRNALHNSISPFLGSFSNTLQWKYSAGSDVYSSPAIGSDGTIYVAVWIVEMEIDGRLGYFGMGQSMYSFYPSGTLG